MRITHLYKNARSLGPRLMVVILSGWMVSSGISGLDTREYASASYEYNTFSKSYHEKRRGTSRPAFLPHSKSHHRHHRALPESPD